MLPGYVEIIFVLFLTAGLFKAEPWLAWLPVDLTLLAALGVALLVLRQLLRTQVIPGAVFALVPLFISFLPSLFWTEWTPYATEKVTYFFSLTLLATVAPVFLLNTSEALRRLLNVLSVVGVFVACNAFYLFFTDPTRFERLGETTPISAISVGRMSGVALLWLATLLLSGRIRPALALPVVCLLASVILGVGSRGPLICTAIALVALFILRARGWSSLGRYAVLLLPLAIGLQIGFGVAPALSTDRVANFLSGANDGSEQTRIQYAVLAANAIQQNPQGIGVAGFQSKIVPWKGGPYPYPREFPHNLVLEIFLEAGWIPGLIFTLLLGVALWKSLRLSIRSPTQPELAGLTSLLVFMLANDLVSGELNDSRILFALLGLSIGLASMTRRLDRATGKAISTDFRHTQRTCLGQAW
jgi:O-antigen ligase